MNQDKVKQKLLAIEDAPLEFSLIFSGKKSKKVNGLYKPTSREIIIHNRNFQPDDTGQNLMLYTAIHEYAHHLHACAHGGKLSPRAHNSEFWAIFHELLEKAGFLRLSIGERSLRTETACTAAAALAMEKIEEGGL